MVLCSYESQSRLDFEFRLLGWSNPANFFLIWWKLDFDAFICGQLCSRSCCTHHSTNISFHLASVTHIQKTRMFHRAWLKGVCSFTTWGIFCFVYNELSFTLTVPLLSNMQMYKFYMFFYMFSCQLCSSVLLTVAFPIQSVTVETSCQLSYFIVNLLFICLFVFIAFMGPCYMSSFVHHCHYPSLLMANCASLYHRH